MPIGALTSRPAPARSARFAVSALAIAVFLAYLAGGRLGVGAAGVDYVFSPADPPALQSHLPAIDVPFDRAPTASTMAARASLSIAKGRRTALRDLAAVAAALTVAAFASWLMAAGVSALPSLLAATAFAFGASNWSQGIAWHGTALAPSLALLSLLSVWQARSGRRSWWIVASVAGFGAISDVTIAAWLAADRGADITNTVRTELTPLGALLALLGSFVLLRSRGARVPTLMATATLVAMYFVMPPWPLAIAGWAAVAVALDWLLSETPARSVRALVAVTSIILIAAPAAARYRLWTLGRDLPAIMSQRTAYDLDPAGMPSSPAFVAESRIVDATISLAARLSHRPVELVAQSEDGLRAMVDSGRPLFALPNSQANLERLGFVFARAFIGITPVSEIAGAGSCLDLQPRESGDVSLLLGGGAFIVRGVEYTRPPGGVTIRIVDRQPVRVTAIDPRSTSYEMTESPDGAAALHLPGTTRIDPVSVTLATPPISARATAEDGAAVRICGVIGAPTLTQATRVATLRLNDETPFGPGWHPIEADSGWFRWTGAAQAGVRVSVPRPAAIEVAVTGAPAAPLSQHPTLALTVNECRLNAQPMTGNDDHRWVVPKECWRSGFNQLWISAQPLVSPAMLFGSHDTRELGARISGIRLTRIVPDQNAK